jgi:hypothetical protein
MTENNKINIEVPETINPEFYPMIDTILARTRENGSCLICGSGGAGKTDVIKWLARQIIASPNHVNNGSVTKLIDPVSNLKFSFDKIPYITLKETSDIPLIQDLLVNMNGLSPSEKRYFLTSILQNDFRKNDVLKNEHGGINPFESWYLIDEAHNVIGRFALVGKKGEDLMDMISEMRNYKMYTISVTRRLTDLSTTFVESCRNVLIGKTIGDNDLKKIESMYGKTIHDEVAKLKPFSFIFYDRDNGMKAEIPFPKFVQVGQPSPLDTAKMRGTIRYIFG